MGSAACRAAARGGRLAPKTGSRRGGRSAAPQEASPWQGVVGAETGGGGKRREVLIHRESRTEPTARHTPARRRGGRARAALPSPPASGPGGADGRSARGWKERTSRRRGRRAGRRRGRRSFPWKPTASPGNILKAAGWEREEKYPQISKYKVCVFLSGPPFPANEQQTKPGKKKGGGGEGREGGKSKSPEEFACCADGVEEPVLQHGVS